MSNLWRGWRRSLLAGAAFGSLLGAVGCAAGAAGPSNGNGAVLTAIFLGVLQGLSEFLPISSSGHLLLAQWLLGVDPDVFGLAFDAAIHLGTLLAVLLYFWRDILELLVAWLGSLIGGRRFSEPDVRLAWGLCLGTIPAAIAGVLFEKQIAESVRSPFIVAAMLALFGALMWIADRVGGGRRDLKDVTIPIAVLVGAAQALALIPGVSRSGSTITMGLFAGLQREAATRFAFLLSAPIVAGAGGKQLFDIMRGKAGTEGFSLALIGTAAAAITGYLVIWFLIRWVATRRLDVFVYYRFAVAALVILLAMLGIARA